VAEGYIKGTSNGIKVDPESSLVFSPPHFTWMDTNYPAGTPREGYPIEIQALWYSALKFLASIEKNKKWTTLAKKVKSSISKYFIFKEIGKNGLLTGRRWLSDCLHCSPMKPAATSIADDHIRPNQLFAITLGAVTDFQLSRDILQITSELLVPGAIRSLADRPTSYKLPIYNGEKLLNDPSNPYWGNYEGVEDIRRKPAYHNGTAWTWPFPSYSEAYYMTYGKLGLKHAISILSSSQLLLENGCIAQIPEVIDGNFPHKQRGCDAQAWGATELYRVWKLLH
jgi:predicted glycogen debranching enzyme